MTTTEVSGQNLWADPSGLTFLNAVAAIIVVDDGRYLMQLRDDKPGIFYPDHWGLFGGGVESGEEPEEALRRELMEELALPVDDMRYFTRMDFDFSPFGVGPCFRIFYEVPLATSNLGRLRLGEGRRMEALEPSDLLLNRRLVPYDSFGLWMHVSVAVAARAAGRVGMAAPRESDGGDSSVTSAAVALMMR